MAKQARMQVSEKVGYIVVGAQEHHLGKFWIFRPSEMDSDAILE